MLTGAAESGKYHKLVSGNIDAKILKIILIGSAYPDKTLLIVCFC